MTAFGPCQPGPTGRDSGINYKFNTATSGDPGSGKLLFNNATLASATALHISETDDDGASVAPMLATWDDGTSTIRGRLLLRKVGTPATYAEFNISGTLTDSGTYDQFTVAHVASNGTISSDDELMLTFVPKGDKGDTGAAGSNGSNGTNGTDGRDAGWNYQRNTATSGAPGSGKFLFNNATIGDATAFHVATTDDDGNNLATPLTKWDDSTASERGYITIRKVGAPTAFVIFTIDGESTSASGYRIFPGFVQQSSGTLSNNDECMVSFTPSGLKPTTSVRSTSTQQLTGGTTYNDLSVTPCEVFVITSTGAGTITINNIAMSAVDGLELVILSRASLSVVLKHATTGTGTATNNFANDGAADITLTTNQKAHCFYSTTANRWITSRLG